MLGNTSIERTTTVGNKKYITSETSKASGSRTTQTGLARQQAEQHYPRYYDGLLIRFDGEFFFYVLLLAEKECFTENRVLGFEVR